MGIMTLLGQLCQLDANKNVFCNSTYSRRTEKANTTIAFSFNLIRSDQTSNSEMPKMKTSSAMAVSSTPFHRSHCNSSGRVPIRLY